MPDENRTEPTATPSPPGRELRSTLTFLAVPALFMLVILLTGIETPPALLYGVGAGCGVALFVRSLSDPEWLMATTIVYMPLSKMFPASIAPLVNGMNMMLVMLVVAWAAAASRAGRKFFRPMPGTGFVTAWAAISCFSMITAMITIGPDFILSDELLEVKGWLDQFVIFYAFVNLIRDGRMAKRLVIYMIVGLAIVMVLGVQEMLQKQGLSNIEKSRVLGPQLQPNDFGAYLVYTIAPLLAYFLHHVYQLRTWLLAPVFGLTVKLLLVTFSRGAYIGFGLAGIAAAYVRGKLFLAFSALLLLGVLATFPEIIPDALMARISSTSSDEGTGEQQLDRSSQTRVILWKAAVDMTLDYPLLGVGFKAFTVMKDQYTELPVRESDNHNMYLYICSQMGIPALLVFLALIYRMYTMGATLYRQAEERWTRVVALGAPVMAAGVLGINMFGSRMIGVDVNGNFWVYFAILVHLWSEHQEQKEPKDRQPG